MMSSETDTAWYDANQRYLAAVLGKVRWSLERHLARQRADVEPAASAAGPVSQDILAEFDVLSAVPALETLCQLFGLSSFERAVLLLCAGCELDASFATLCAAAHEDPQRAAPTFSLALAMLPEPHWSALSPGASLRHWQLIEIGAGESLATSPLRIDERILHYLTGLDYLDEHLVGFVEPMSFDPQNLVPSHQHVAEQSAALWMQNDGTVPVVQLCGNEAAGKRTVAAAAAALVGLNLYVMTAHMLPTGPHEFDLLIRLWKRESALSASALLLDAEDLEAGDAARTGLVVRFLENTGGALLLATRERRLLRHRASVTFDVRKPTTSEQRTLWQDALGPAAPAANGQVAYLTAQFDLNAPAIWAACTQVMAGDGTAPALDRLWEACRAQTRPRLRDLAQRIEPITTWDDLVLPDLQRQILHATTMHVRHRMTVYERWGFAAKSSRGLGISALFAGASGTGKTMAAEVLANELKLDLYRIDLSRVVSKYIGETEKNLARVFDAAEEGGAILLFDEADALFGKRSEVKDSHDRYANIEISYLLQRMESYRGLAILTTNMKDALDDAFMRRIRFIVSFPFPNAAQRAEIWRRIFPHETPTDGLDAEKLARLNVTGGNIRNIAMHAAFLAADAGEPVRMAHVLHAARSEYIKLEKPLTTGEIRGWI